MDSGIRHGSNRQTSSSLAIHLPKRPQVDEGDTFVRRVAQSTGLSAVNLARGAYGPQQELIVLKRYGLAYKPRVVVWQLFEGNDLHDAEAFAEWKQNPQQVSTSLRSATSIILC